MAALRFALVGCGRIASLHYNAMQGVKQSCRVTALVDTNRETAEAMRAELTEKEACKVR